MIVWERHGWMALVGIGVLKPISDALTAQGLSPFVASGGTGLVIGAALYWIGRRFEADGAEHIVIDKATGMSRKVEIKDRLLFIPVKYWGFVCAFYGIVAPIEAMMKKGGLKIEVHHRVSLAQR